MCWKNGALFPLCVKTASVPFFFEQRSVTARAWSGVWWRLQALSCPCFGSTAESRSRGSPCFTHARRDSRKMLTPSGRNCSDCFSLSSASITKWLYGLWLRGTRSTEQSAEAAGSCRSQICCAAQELVVVPHDSCQGIPRVSVAASTTGQ